MTGIFNTGGYPGFNPSVYGTPAQSTWKPIGSPNTSSANVSTANTSASGADGSWFSNFLSGGSNDTSGIGHQILQLYQSNEGNSAVTDTSTASTAAVASNPATSTVDYSKMSLSNLINGAKEPSIKSTTGSDSTKNTGFSNWMLPLLLIVMGQKKKAAA